MAPNAGQGKPSATPSVPVPRHADAARNRNNSDAESEHSGPVDVPETPVESSDESGDNSSGESPAGDPNAAAQQSSAVPGDTEADGSLERGLATHNDVTDDSMVAQPSGTQSTVLRLMPPDGSGRKKGSARPLTKDQARTLRSEGFLPNDKAALASAPAQYAPTSTMTSDGVLRIVGIPATQEHLDARIHTQNGYGGMEALLPMESLGVGDIARLDGYFEESANPHDVLLVPRPEPLPEKELDIQMRSLDLQREMASIVTEFDVPNLAQRVIGTVSLLRRLAIERQLMQTQLGQDSSASARDAVDARGEVVRLERALKVQAEHFEHKLQTLTSNREYTSQEFKEDLRLMMEEHERNVAGLKDQVASLTQALNEALANRQTLERQLQQARFDSGEVMNFLNDNAQLMLHWPRLLHLLEHLQDGTTVPSSWNSMITVTALDDPTSASGAYVRQHRPDDEEHKESGPPTPFVDLTGDAPPEGSRGGSNKRQRSSSGWKRTPQQATFQLQESDRIQEFPSEWDETSHEGCRSSHEKLVLSDPAHEMTMRTGISYTGALQWLDEDRKAHTLFHMDSLIEMLVRMMYWGRLDSVFWTKYVPRRYFKVARSKVDELLDNEIQPPTWGDLVVQADEGIDPEDILPEEDDKSKDGDWQADDEQLDEDVDKLLDDSPSKRTRKRSKLRRLDSPSQSKSASKRTSVPTGEATTLAQKDFSKLTLREIMLVERPDLHTKSWLRYGVRMIRSPPSARATFQTSGFPSYAPNRHDFELLYSRFDFNAYQELLDTCPWEIMFTERELRFFFHKRSELTKQDRAGVQEWLAFMLERSRALWDWLHWVPFLPNDSSSEAFQREHSQRTSRHDSLRKCVETKKKKLVRKGMSESLFHEPGLWTFPVKICSWILMHPQHVNPDTGKSYTLQEQLRLLDATEPARVQWAGCPDDKAIAHLPADIRGRLIPPFERELIPCAF